MIIALRSSCESLQDEHRLVTPLKLLDYGV